MHCILSSPSHVGRARVVDIRTARRRLHRWRKRASNVRVIAVAIEYFSGEAKIEICHDCYFAVLTATPGQALVTYGHQDASPAVMYVNRHIYLN